MSLSDKSIEVIKSGEMIACHECDLLVKLPDIDKVQVVSCPRCNFTITRFNDSVFARVFSFSVSAFIFALIAYYYDFLTIEVAGADRDFAIIDSVFMLFNTGNYVFAVICLLMIFVFPIGMLLSVLYLVWSVHYRLNLPGLVLMYKLLYFMKTWAMAEVFVIGALVSLIKIAGMASVSLGIAFWAYIIFALLLSVTVNSVDKLQLWRHIESIKNISHG